jgi:hypothetical protein
MASRLTDGGNREACPQNRHDTAGSGFSNLEIIMIRHVATAIALVLVAGCHKAGAPDDARRLASALTGDAKSGADANPLCKLFSIDEASAYAGIPLNAGTNAVMGTGCQWGTGRGAGMIMITADPIANADHPSHAPHFRELPELGKGAYVDADMGGWTASAPQGKEFIGVVVTGPNASEKTAIALMTETLKRRQ